MKYVVTINEREYQVEIMEEGRVNIDGTELTVDYQSVSGQPIYSLIVNGHSYEAFVSPNQNEWQVMLHGNLYEVRVEDERERRLRAAAVGSGKEHAEFNLKAPMPGLVVAIPVSEGQEVKKGEVLVILESMKMQNELKSPKAGTVGAIRVNVGTSVEQKQVLLTVE
ncbi:MAG: biotin/lipoyl-binding protein [Anaerolineales bacterium]|nr:biotin/lipoyl-binding protein [Anaerolineales bacterium]